MESMQRAIDLCSFGIEAFAVAVIVICIVFASLRFAIQTARNIGSAYTDYKLMLGKSLLLGLEFLVAADVIRTVALAPTLLNIGILGILVMVRTFLSWSLVVEMEGRWPWNSASSRSPID